MYSSSDHVIRAGQKYTISSPSGRGMSVDYKSVFRLAISRTVLEKSAKKSENREIWAKFDPPANFFGGASKILKPVLGTSFQGLLPKKIGPRPLTLRGWEKISPPKFFWGGGPPKGYISSVSYTHLTLPTNREV